MFPLIKGVQTLVKSPVVRNNVSKGLKIADEAFIGFVVTKGLEKLDNKRKRR